MKKPIIKDYCKPFFLDPHSKDLVSFDSKGYAKDAAAYIEHLEKTLRGIAENYDFFIKIDNPAAATLAAKAKKAIGK
jgi:hypothetical protein